MAKGRRPALRLRTRVPRWNIQCDLSGRCPKQQDVVGVDRRGVGLLGVARPDGSTLEGGQSLPSAGHIGEAAKPDEAVGVVQIAELAQQTHANFFLRLDKLLFEQRDKRLPLPRMQGISPQLDDRGWAAHRRRRRASALVWSAQHRARCGDSVRVFEIRSPIAVRNRAVHYSPPSIVFSTTSHP
jgi:hypothetical protein